MANTAVKYCVGFESDYHIGSGLGIAGVVDDTLIKDSKGRPIIPGSTLKGVIRDACEDLVDALNIHAIMCDGTVKDGKKMCGVNHDVSHDGNTCLLCLIFGSEVIPSHFRFQSARRRDAISELVVDAKASPLLRSSSRVETHNRIDPRTGTASKNHLFAYELGRRSDPYEANVFQIRSFVDADQEKDALALLVGGMRFVMRMGGKRRRGKGRCRFHIEDTIHGKFNEYTWAELIDHLPELQKRGGNV